MTGRVKTESKGRKKWPQNKKREVRENKSEKR